MNNPDNQCVNDLYRNYGINEEIIGLADSVMQEIEPVFESIRNIREYNQLKVISAFREVRLSDSHFAGTTGYGYDDSGRDRLEKAFAIIFGAESALLRWQISSGTSAIAMALFGILRPGDILLSVTGRPYDTLTGVIGMDGSDGSGTLADFGIGYRQTDLGEDGKPDGEAIADALGPDVKVVFIQKSKGYTNRSSLLNEDIGRVVEIVRNAGSNAYIVVDNCYGEFVETSEPCSHGADLCCGSLIKNPGGGICTTGGYIAGRADLVEMAACRLTAPGVGSHIGPSMGMNRMIAMGLYMAPHAVGEALMGAAFSAALFERLGYGTIPGSRSVRGDIVQSFVLGSAAKVISFCRSIQHASPIDSFVTPEPWDMPGYDSPVIMAAGAFTQGASIEMSCDSPIRPPYIAYFQGGIVYENVRFAAMLAASQLG
ncbi:MAG: methionine gamma-lyase family protein [Saccharofermentanales bacterium]